MGFIYKITNDVNGKVYIGQTIRSVWVRWRNHVSQAYNDRWNSCPRLHRAIRKYGEDSFTCEPIVKAPDMVLDDLERYWINYYDSINTGYNITLGGKSGGKKADDTAILEKWNSGMTIREICKCLGYGKSTISSRLHALGVRNEETRERGWRKGSEKSRIPVYMYDLKGNYVRSFKSIKEANAFLGKVNGVSPALSGTILQTGGYMWRTYKAEKIEPYNPEHAQIRSVAKLDMDGNVLEVFASMKDAAKAVNGCHANIIRACKNPWKTCCGFKWKYI